MAVRGLDHVNISTTRVAETRDFFAEVLGFETGWRPELPFDGAWMYAAGKDLVHIAEVKDDPRPSRGSALDHFAFAIDDYDAARARLDASGVKYRALEVAGSPIRQLFFNEPNGATIELNCRS